MKSFFKRLLRNYFKQKEKECKEAFLWYEIYCSAYPEYEKTLAYKSANLTNEIGKLYGSLAKELE